MDGPIKAEKPTNLFLLDAASSDKGLKLLRNSARVGPVQFGDLSAVMSHLQNAIFSLLSAGYISHLK